MKLKQHEYASDSEKNLDRAIGFIGWFIVNGLLFFLLTNSALTSPNALGEWLGLLPWIVNLGGIVFFAFTRSQIAVGALIAIAALLVLAVVLGLLVVVVCFVGTRR